MKQELEFKMEALEWGKEKSVRFQRFVAPDGSSAHPAGFEPTACRLGGGRSILLSYGCMP